MSRGHVGPKGVRARDRSPNHGDDGGTKKGTPDEVPRDAEVETKQSSQSPKRKHDAKGGGGTAHLPWKFL